jgi:hypothetical protein
MRSMLTNWGSHALFNPAPRIGRSAKNCADVYTGDPIGASGVGRWRRWRSVSAPADLTR